MRDVIDVRGAAPNQCKLGDGGELKKKGEEVYLLRRRGCECDGG